METRAQRGRRPRGRRDALRFEARLLGFGDRLRSQERRELSGHRGSQLRVLTGERPHAFRFNAGEFQLRVGVETVSQELQSCFQIIQLSLFSRASLHHPADSTWCLALISWVIVGKSFTF